VRRLAGLESDPAAPALREPVCTVGVFDGVHRGHRQLIYELNAWAQAADGQSCVITFERHPLETLRGIRVPMILSLESRLLEFQRLGVEATLVLDFARVRPMSAAEFLEQVVRDRLGCHRLLLGFDSRLGHDREGGPENLPEIGRALGIEVRVASPVRDRQGAKVGSSRIRAAIERGDLATAANMLGHPYHLRGRVVHGDGRGEELGTATANLDVDHQVLPPDGVYLVRVFHGEATAPGVANLGRRPTFGEGGPRVLEVHVPGWSGPLYGEALEVRLVRRLRGEERFPDAGTLRAQIARDLQALAQAVDRGEV